MLIDFFYTLRAARLPVSVKEHLSLLSALQAGIVGPGSLHADNPMLSLDDFYHLARMTLIKDEKHYDKFDRAFGQYFHGVSEGIDLRRELPQEWLRKNLEGMLTEEEKAAIEKMGWEELMQTLKDRLNEQKERHEGGNKWIGTGGTSPFGAHGFNPSGIRIGGEKSREKKAVKVWDKREFRDYDEGEALSPRNIQLALKRLRRFARTGAAEQLDLDGTIRATANNAGWLDLQMIPERHNSAKVLLLMDVGGSMDEHIERVEQLFSGARAEFKHLEFFYFHNCVYDFVWRKNERRFQEKTSTLELIRTYNKDYKLIFVGDATMAPYEVLQPYGCSEYDNEEAGAVWIDRLTQAFPHFVWLNPEPSGVWPYRQSIQIVQQLLAQQMYPLTLAGLESAMRQLSK